MDQADLNLAAPRAEVSSSEKLHTGNPSGSGKFAGGYPASPAYSVETGDDNCSDQSPGPPETVMGYYVPHEEEYYVGSPFVHSMVRSQPNAALSAYPSGTTGYVGVPQEQDLSAFMQQQADRQQADRQQADQQQAEQQQADQQQADGQRADGQRAYWQRAYGQRAYGQRAYGQRAYGQQADQQQADQQQADGHRYNFARYGGSATPFSASGVADSGFAAYGDYLSDAQLLEYSSGNVVSGGGFGENSRRAAQEKTVMGEKRMIKGEERVVGSRVVRHEMGAERIISVTERVDEETSYVVSERWVDHEVKVPKRIVREDIIEKVIVVPERILTEEIIEETVIVMEKIVEIARPIIVEKIIEIPEYEYVEKVVEVPERVIQERLVEVEKVEYEDRVQEVEKIIEKEVIREVPVVEYREVPVVREVEVEDWRTETIYKDVAVPQYVEVAVPETVETEETVDIERNIPLCVEAELTCEFAIPRIKANYHKVTYPVYIPRFVEVPVAAEILEHAGIGAKAAGYIEQLSELCASRSLCDIENLATEILSTGMHSIIQGVDMQTVLMNSWRTGVMSLQK